MKNKNLLGLSIITGVLAMTFANALSPINVEAYPLHNEQVNMIRVGAYSVASTAFASTPSGKVYSWGYNGRGAQPGVSSLAAVYAPVDRTASFAFNTGEYLLDLDVSKGGGVVAVTNQGRIFAWGIPSLTATTNGKSGATPTLVTGTWNFGTSKATQVATGLEGTAFLSEDGRTVLTIGRGPELGNAVAYQEDPELYTSFPNPVNITPRFALGATEKIIHLTNSYGTFLAISDLGNVWFWGFNFKHLGFGNNEAPSIMAPKKATLPTLNANERVIRGELSYDHTILLTNQGRLLVTGYNGSNQLGNVFSGILGTGTRNDIYTGFGIVSIPGEVIKEVAVGSRHSVALTVSNKVYTTGHDGNKQLGNGPDLTASVLTFTEITSRFPNLGTYTLSQLTANTFNTMVLRSDGRVYAWGNNGVGELGIDITENEFHSPVQLFDNNALRVQLLIDALPTPITLADRSAVETARTEYNKLTGPEFVLVNNLGKLQLAEADLVELRIAALPTLNAITLADETEITNLRAAYNALNQTQKASINNLSTLVAAEAKLQELKDRAAALVVDNQILAIAQPLSLAQKAEVQAARTAYNALTTAQKSYVAQLPLLETLESTLVDLENQAAAATVSNLIGALPSPIALTDQTAVEAARAAYDALTSTQQTLVLNEAVLTAAEAALVLLTNQVAADATITLITALPNPITLEDEAAVVAARASYDALTSDQKALVTNLTILTSAEATIISLKNEAAAALVIDLIDNLPSPITLDDQDATEAARAAYDALTSSQQALVDNLSALTSAETAIVGLLSEVADVIALINNLPDPLDVDDQAAVEAARDAFDALTTTSQDYVTNAEDLLAAEALLNDLFEAVDVTINAITDLPDLEDLTLEDGESLRAARAYYDALSPAQQALIANLSSLEALEVRYLELLAIQAIEDRIDELPSLEDVTLEDEAAILEVYEDYLALSTTNQNEVENRHDLFDLLQRLEVLNVTSDVTSFPDVEGFDDLLNDRDTREETIASLLELWDRYQNLTEEEKALLDPESRAQLEALYAHYLKATNPMNTVWFISILMLHLAAAGYFVYTNRKQFLKKA